MKIFKNKFFVIAAAVVLALTVTATVFSAMGRADLLSDAVHVVTYPGRWLCARAADGMRGFGSYFGAVKRQSEEIESLQNALDDAKDAADAALLLEEENERLRAYLGMKAANPSYTYEAATVIGRSTEKYVSVLMLNKGAMHGIQTGMPVLTEDGVVGYVSEVGTTFCKVTTVLSSSGSVGVYVARTGVLGVLTGAADGLCTVQYIETGEKTVTEPQTENGGKREAGTGSETESETEEETEEKDASGIRVGDTVFTTGVGAVYPTGLTVGKVTALTVDPYSRKTVATVQPAADLSRALSFVVILTGTGEEQP